MGDQLLHGIAKHVPASTLELSGERGQWPGTKDSHGGPEPLVEEKLHSIPLTSAQRGKRVASRHMLMVSGSFSQPGPNPIPLDGDRSAQD